MGRLPAPDEDPTAKEVTVKDVGLLPVLYGAPGVLSFVYGPPDVVSCEISTSRDFLY